MENIIDEDEIKGSIDPATKSQTKIILKQMEKSVCKIFGKKKGTGFFCKIELNKKKTPVLVTNYHIIDDKFLEENTELKFFMGDEQISKQINLDKSSKIYSSPNEEYDIMVIKLNENDDLKDIYYLEIDEHLLNKNSESAYGDKSIYILHYPMGREITVSYGYGITYEKEKKYEFIHKCKKVNGSSGSPILNLATNKLIGIHKSFISNINKNISYNIGSFLKYPLIEMQKLILSNKIFKKINNIKPNPKKINKQQVKIETNNYKRVNNEIPKEHYSYRQSNINDLNNNNNNEKNLITEYENFDVDTLNKQNVIFRRNISTSKTPIKNNNCYSKHCKTKSNFHLNKIPNLIANEKKKEKKYLNMYLNYMTHRINGKHRATSSEHNMLSNNLTNKSTNINKDSLNDNNQKKLSSNKPSDSIERNIYKIDNYDLTNNRKYVANNKNNYLLISDNANKINKKPYGRFSSTPILNRNNGINYKGKQTRLFEPVNTPKK